MSPQVHRSLADLWSVSNRVQREAWLGRARQGADVVEAHAHKDWTELPPKVAAALMGVK